MVYILTLLMTIIFRHSSDLFCIMFECLCHKCHGTGYQIVSFVLTCLTKNDRWETVLVSRSLSRRYNLLTEADHYA